MTCARLAPFAFIFLSLATLRADDSPPLPKPTPVPDAATLERDFEQRMSGATLTGFFTVAGREDGQPLKEEKYTINKVSKLKDGFWLVNTRIQYGKHDATVSLPIEVKWAGDTPVMTLTNVNVPGFGTFTCRVLVYRDQYSGTWSGGDHGGHLFGRLTKD
jgi:hypothetical protein